MAQILNINNAEQIIIIIISEGDCLPCGLAMIGVPGAPGPDT